MKNSKFTLTLIASAISVALCAPVSSVFAGGGILRLPIEKKRGDTSQTKTMSTDKKKHQTTVHNSMKKHKNKKNKFSTGVWPG